MDLIQISILSISNNNKMNSTIYQVIPIVFGLLSFFCATKQKMVAVNFLLCVSWIFAFIETSAYSGALVAFVAGLSSLYVAITNSVLTKRKALFITVIMLLSVIGINSIESSSLLFSLLPLIAFAVYRYGELGFEEEGYRWLSVFGGMTYMIYAFINDSWGVWISEGLLVAANIFYLYINIYKDNFNGSLAKPLSRDSG